MTDREELSQQALVAAAFEKLAADMKAGLRPELARAFTKVGQRESGEINGQHIGTVQLIKGTSTWTVNDPEAWLRWVSENAPEEVITTRSVRSSYTTAVLAKLKAGEAEVDEESGELLVPSGIIPKSSPPSLRITPTKDAPQILLNALGEMAVVLGLAVAGELEA